MGVWTLRKILPKKSSLFSAWQGIQVQPESNKYAAAPLPSFVSPSKGLDRALFSSIEQELGAAMGTTTWTRGTHVFEISGYSHWEVLGGAFPSVSSAIFAVGGYDWQIRFYPGGFHENFKDYVSVWVHLLSNNNGTRVRASVQLSLVDVTRSLPPHTTKWVFFDTGSCRSCAWNDVTRRSNLAPYLRDDCLTIECVITLDKESQVQSAAELPPSDIMEHLRNLLQAKEGADVVFEVQGVAFPAHRTVLAMRSPIFKAELYGPMREKDMSRITIGDMQPAVFEVLLHFMYTDSLPVMDDVSRGDYGETIRHLLVAADRYAMERLKMICESILCNNINVKTVVTTMVLADQHHCGRLSHACIQFIASLSTMEMDDLMASQGYVELKETCPLAIVEFWEKTNRLHYKSKSSFHIGT